MGEGWLEYMDVNPKIGGFYPPKWMVKIMENPMNKWMIWGFSHIFGLTPILLDYWYIFWGCYIHRYNVLYFFGVHNRLG